MFKKMKLKRSINKCKKQIEAIEQKRARSQAKLVEAILTHTTPNDDDVDYFNRYTGQIEDVRREMHEYETQLKNL